MTSQVAAPLIRQERRLRMSYDDFLAFADEDIHGEWVDGEVTVFMPASGIHQDLIGFLYILLSWFTRHGDLGRVRLAPFAMRVEDLGWSREPDLLFIARHHLHRLTETRLIGPADLVVEVVSDDSERRDYDAKRQAYQAAGIPEYWLLDPRSGHRQAQFLRLDANGVYYPAALDDRGRFHSAVLPGFWLDPTWLWQDPLPDPDALKPLILAGSRRPGGASNAE